MLTQLARVQLRVVALLVAVLFAAWGVAALTQVSAHHHNRALNKQNATQQHFWRAVAGVDSTDAATVDNLLASDLRDLQGAEIAGFRGNSNRYGGITDAIGRDPFDGTGQGCVECGPLTADVQKNLRSIHDGHLLGVLAATNVERDTSGFRLTPGGIPFWLAALVWYLTLGPTTYLIACRIRGERPTPDAHLLVASPPWWAFLHLRAAAAQGEEEDGLRVAFPDQVAALERVDEAIASMPRSPDRILLEQERDQVRAELSIQVRQAQSARDADTLRALTEQLEDTRAFLKARAEAKKTLQ